jgi:Family of unknown function (DUF6492)
MRQVLVTVAHEGDWPLLQLQAHSFALYLPERLVEEIIVIENPRRRLWWSQPIIANYGPLASKVRFVDASDLCPHISTGHGGWWTQQVLKLLVASTVPAERYVVLDAKHHLVYPLGLDFLETRGVPRIRCYGYRGHPLHDALERTLAYFGLPVAPYLNLFVGTTPPFTIYKDVVLRLIRYVEEREGRPFAEAFLDRRLTEFFAYGAFILAAGGQYQDMYDLDQPRTPTVWDDPANALSCLMAVDEAESCERPFFAIHRRACARLPEDARHVIAQFWRRRGLFDRTSDALLSPMLSRPPT